VSILLVLIVFCSVLAAASLAQSVVARRELRASLDRAAGIAAPAPAQEFAISGRRLPLVERLARLALAVRPGANREDLALRLAGAGLARRVSPDAFLAVQGALFVGSALLGVLTIVAGSVGVGIFLALVGFATALLVPDRLLAARTSRRAELVLAELPGALDLLAISVEAGLGFDAALARVADVSDGPLSEELALMLSEIRVGEARSVALQRLADRIGVNDVAVFARAVIRADQLGTSLGQTLRVQAADARARRQLAAEEKAGKAPVKMLFPTVVFIFPALFVVVLGPAVLQLGSYFGS
jgi:tight adherence protein C